MAGNMEEFSVTQTPERACMRVPFGHLLVNSKWRNSDLTLAIQGVNVLYEDNLGYIDFHPATHIGVVFATESDLVSQVSIRRKLAKLRKANQVQVLVLAEKTASSCQYFQSLQKFVSMELGFIISPVPSRTEAAGLLVQMVQSTMPCFPTEECSVHKARLLEMFCKDHDDIVCATCVALSHRTCKGIHSIPDEVDTLYKRSDTTEVNIQLTASKEALEEMKKAKKDLISRLDNSRKIANDSIRKLRKEMEAILEKMEKESMKVVEAEYRRNEALLQEQIKEIESLTTDLEQSAEKLKKSDGNKAQEFVCVKASLKCLKKMKKAERLLISKGPVDVELEFVTDPKLHTILQEEKTFGQIITKISKYTPRSTVYTVKQQRKVCVKEASDVHTCRIVGSCFTEYGSLLLTDYDNKKLKHVDMSTDCIIDCLAMEASPISVCLTDANEAAVSLDNQTIQFISLKNKLSAGRKLKLDHICYGMACKDNKLFMTDQHKGFYIYDSVGTLLHGFTADKSAIPVLKKSRHVSLGNKQDKVYLAESVTGLITFDLQGNYRSCLTFPDVPIPQGVCVDGRGNIFLSGWDSSAVIQISEKSHTVLGVLANVTNTFSACFNPHQNILVVSAYMKNSVTVFELE